MPIEKHSTGVSSDMGCGCYGVFKQWRTGFREEKQTTLGSDNTRLMLISWNLRRAGGYANEYPWGSVWLKECQAGCVGSKTDLTEDMCKPSNLLSLTPMFS